jgi:hypothetical protein
MKYSLKLGLRFSLPVDPPCSSALQNFKREQNSPHGSILTEVGGAWEGHLLGGGEEVRDVLVPGGMVGVPVYYVTKYPSFVHRNPVWIWFSRKMIIQRWEKLEKLQTNGEHWYLRSYRAKSRY